MYSSHTGTPPKHEEEDDESSDPNNCLHHIENVSTSIQMLYLLLVS
jgi:hypothetical protein